MNVLTALLSSSRTLNWEVTCASPVTLLVSLVLTSLISARSAKTILVCYQLRAFASSIAMKTISLKLVSKVNVLVAQPAARRANTRRTLA